MSGKENDRFSGHIDSGASTSEDEMDIEESRNTAKPSNSTTGTQEKKDYNVRLTSGYGTLKII